MPTHSSSSTSASASVDQRSSANLEETAVSVFKSWNRDIQTHLQARQQAVSTRATNKVRQDLLRAIESKTPSVLQGVLNTGVDVNFLGIRKGFVLSPLALACLCEWEEGGVMLLDAGASPSRVDAFFAALSVQEREVFQGGQRSLSVEQAVTSASMFEKLVRLESNNPNFCRRLANQVCRHDWGPRLLVEHQLVKVLGEGARCQVEEALLIAALKNTHDLPLLERFWRQVPEQLLVQPEKRWHFVLEKDALPVMGLMASLLPPQPPSALQSHVLVSDFLHLSLRRAEGALPFGRDPCAPANQVRYRERSDPLPLWLCALLLGATQCLRTMAGSPEWMEPVQDLPDRRAWLALCTTASTLREAARQGLDLSECQTDSLENPLHFLCGQEGPKQPILDLARVHPAWITQASAAGKTPLERLSAQIRNSPLAATLETLVLEQSIGLRNEQGRKVIQRKPRPVKPATNKTEVDSAVDAPTPRVRRRL